MSDHAFVVNHGCREVEIWEQFLHHPVIQLRGRPEELQSFGLFLSEDELNASMPTMGRYREINNVVLLSHIRIWATITIGVLNLESSSGHRLCTTLPLTSLLEPSLGRLCCGGRQMEVLGFTFLSKVLKREIKEIG